MCQHNKKVDTDGSKDVSLGVALLGVAGHSSDGQHLHLAPLVGLQRHQQRHRVIHPGVRVNDQLPPHSETLVGGYFV